jgi:rare lipoprotein A
MAAALMNAIMSILNLPSAAWLAATFLSVLDLGSAAIAAEDLRDQFGIASTYSYKGEQTASGDVFNPENMTAAHRSLPFGTIVRVTNTQNGHFAVVRINDRGPFISGRIIDVSPAAAHALGFVGLTQVSLSVMTRADLSPMRSHQPETTCEPGRDLSLDASASRNCHGF